MTCRQPAAETGRVSRLLPAEEHRLGGQWEFQKQDAVSGAHGQSTMGGAVGTREANAALSDATRLSTVHTP